MNLQMKITAILTAAIKTNANLIVINNIKDFLQDYRQTFGLTAKTADDFLTDIIDLNHEQAIAAFKKKVLHKKPKTRRIRRSKATT